MEKHEKMDGCYVLTWTWYNIIHAYY